MKSPRPGPGSAATFKASTVANIELEPGLGKTELGDLLVVNGHRPAELQAKPSATAVAFLRKLDADGRHNLVAFDPSGGGPSGRTFEPGAWDEISEWIDAREGRLNLYFSVNEPRAVAPDDKLAKADIVRLRAIFADVDPIDGEPLEKERRRLDELFASTLPAMPVPPTATWDTGGGCQALWKLAVKLPAEEHAPTAEDLGRGVAVMLEGDKVQNIDRIGRLPGTLNIPDAGKRAKGRTERRGRILFDGGAHYTLDGLAQHIAPVSKSAADDRDPAVQEARRVIEASTFREANELHDLPEDLRRRFDLACSWDPALARLWAGEIEGTDRSGSEYRRLLAHRLGRLRSMGYHFDVVDFASLAWVWDFAVQLGHDREERLADGRRLARDWARCGQPRADEAAAFLAKWFDADAAAEARRADWERAEHQSRGGDLPGGHASASTAALIDWIDPAAWAGASPPPREWLVDNFIPAKEVTLLYGVGGVGKTLLAHQLAVALATGSSWVGQPVKPARVLMFLCEDGPDELHRRHADICAAAGFTPADTSAIRISSRRTEDNLLAAWDRQTGVMKLRPVWERLRDDALAFRADVVIIDTIADVFGGNENDRAQVTAFAKGCLGRLAREIDGTVIALGHPSVAGAQSGSGTSGSTAWSNAVRSRLFLRYPEHKTKGDVRELEGMKANYAAAGSLLKVRWRRGAFELFAASTPAGSGAPSAQTTVSVPSVDDAAEAAVVSAIASCPDERLVMAKTSTNCAWKRLRLLAPEILQPWTAGEVEAALNRLLGARLISEAEVGRDASRRPVMGLRIEHDRLSERAARSAEDGGVFG